MILRGSFRSETLRMNTNIQVFVPDRCTPARVVYLLHGLHGDQGQWIDNTMLPVYAKKYNAIFIMPEAKRSFYANQKYGRRYYDYISNELPEICRRIFNINAAREDTAIVGCSMGGYGALWFALSLPEQYGFCGAIAPACLNIKEFMDEMGKNPPDLEKTEGETREILADLHAIYGEKPEYRADYDITELAKNFPPDKPKPEIYITCGTRDEFRKDILAFKNEMENTEFKFTYEEWQGGHEWFFFNEALKKTLEYWYN